ncbi:DUF4215 domain-containing protein [Patescibacteria group bacterium]|nr:DUF4215 domain-containing protein [Patescibacteria group bacterium]
MKWFVPFFQLLAVVIIFGSEVHAQIETVGVATTTITLSICGNSLVDSSEDCDVPGETGVYSTTIVGRQCTPTCKFGPYCGDGILQTQFTEECDDGNNTSLDFCSATCKIEPAGSGGGGSSGGGGGSGGGERDLGDTQISVTGIGYPSQTINFLLDTKSIGSVRANSSGRFEFAADASPGTATLGVWAVDSAGKRSITLNNTFDVTQGAVTNVSGLILPPTISVANPNVIPGSIIAITGQSIPSVKVDVHFNNSEIVESVTSGADGKYTLNFNSTRLRNAEYTIKARSVSGVAPLLTQSSFSTSLQLFVGVDGRATSPSDLSRDGKVNLVDFSILIFWWQTAGGDSNPPADINGNGRVSLEDFSILLFNWTG